MTEEQKPEEVARCKFCGGPGKILESHAIIHEYWGYCYDCRARTTYYMTRKEALKAWNREAPNAESRRLRELERAVAAIRAAMDDERTHLMAAYLQAWREGYRKGRADHLSDLEMAVRDAMHPLPMGRGWVWRGDATDIAAIGRLLEGEG